MTTDGAKIKLTPGGEGKKCLGSGSHESIECLCDECDYLSCCFDEDINKRCAGCEGDACWREKTKIL